MVVFRQDKILQGFYSNERFYNLPERLTDSQARLSLIEFLRANLGIATELLLGFKIFPYQEIMIKNMFENDFSMWVASRGGAKSWTVCVFCILYLIFNPNARIVISANTFRSSKRILAQIEKFLGAKGAELAKQCFPKDLRKGTDSWELHGNGGVIQALPLNEKIRGTRADILIIDEFLLIPEHIYTDILFPFLTAKSNIQEQMKLQELQKELLDKKLIGEDEKITFESDKKIIALTSASYDFEFCYRLYTSWANSAVENDPKASKYFVSRLSYLAIPSELVEENIIKEAEKGGLNSPYFQREYMAKFATASEGFFSIKHMMECTIPEGELPCVQIHGMPNTEYILAIDPSFSSGKNSDFFAMGLFLLDKENKRITLVNSYAAAGGELKNHILYLKYLMSSFNIVFIIADLLGGGGENFNFIEVANQSEAFRQDGLHLKFIEGVYNYDEEEMRKQFVLGKKSYNHMAKRICYSQNFSSGGWIKRANEYMQHQIQGKKVWFASKICNHEEEFDRYKDARLPVKIPNKFGGAYTMADFLDDQDEMIDETKSQIALIEQKVTASGHSQFDLPATIKSIKGEKRARRDNYTTTLMACWGAKIYFDLMDDTKTQSGGFIPFFLN